MKPRIILTMEQALSLPSATLRFAQLGWRVIRIEGTASNSDFPGDPNRYVGKTIADNDRSSYFLPQNVGKEALALNLKEKRGQEILHRLIRELDVDVFCCNTLPSRYESLGIDYETLSGINPRLIWAGISAMGPEYPTVPGYDPALQAMSGYMELTGDPDGPPTLMGLPVIDLKAGDEVYAGVWKGLTELADTGRGQAINISMLQAASSWLITTMALLDFDPDSSEVTRCGNQHRKFIPTDTFKTKDGHCYLAIGNDLQWKRLTEIPKFYSVITPARYINSGRHQERKGMYSDLRAVMGLYTTAELANDFRKARVPWSEVNNIYQVRELEAIRSKMTSSVAPDGSVFYMQPMAVDADEADTNLSFPPKYGEHTEAILREAGYSQSEIMLFEHEHVIAHGLPQREKC